MILQIIVIYMIIGYVLGLISCMSIKKNKPIDEFIKTMIVWTFFWLFIFIFGHIPLYIFFRGNKD